MKNELYAYFDDNPTYAYRIVIGSVYSEEFNETIDSFSIELDMVDSEHRIDLSRPYHIVKIVNKGTNGIKWKDKNGVFHNYIFMYTNSTVIEETNIDKKYYAYTIELMNIIKALENIQCPNLVITHDLVTGQTQTIYDYIDKYMTLYCPKIKVVNGDNWEYQYLFNWQSLEEEEPFKTLVADMQVNKPTLRDLLTTLMTQVDCIPTMDYRELGYINFREAPSDFAYQNNGVNRFNLSNASDSYLNTIIQEPNQTLDTDNKVTEIIGFRNDSAPVLRQQENLQLKTRYSIYKIDQVKLFRINNNKIRYKPNYAWVSPDATNQLCPAIGSLTRLNHLDRNYVIYGGNNPDWPVTSINYNFYYPKIFEIKAEQDDYNDFVNAHIGEKVLHLEFCFLDSVAPNWNTDGELKNIKIHFCDVDNVTKAYRELSVKEVNQSWILANDSVSGSFGKRLLPDGDLSLEEPYSAIDVNSSIYYGVYTFYLDIPLGVTSFGNATHIWIEFVYEKDFHEYYGFYPVCKIVDVIYGGSATFEDFQNYKIAYYDEESEEIIYLYGKFNQTILAGWQFSPEGTETEFMRNENYFNDNSNPMYFIASSKLPNYVDVTPLFVEESKRQLLDTNFVNMQNDNITNCEELGKYVYGTVGYTIGTNIISGFSTKYSYLTVGGLYSVSETYFDNILDFIKRFGGSAISYTQYSFEENYFVRYRQYNANMPTNFDTLLFYYGDFSEGKSVTNKAEFLFEITYYPLNSFKMKWTKKEEFDYPIERLNNLDSGLNTFERLSKKAQSMVDRIGNPILTITQTTDNFNNLQQVNSVYTHVDGRQYTIFKRQIEINEEYFSAIYYGSEKYVMQNYFTSITTKYRAYQYVDYGASVVRKENKTIYCLLAKDYYIDGDDNLYINYAHTLLLGCVDYDVDLYEDIKYLIEESEAETNQVQRCKTNINSLANENGFSLINENYDNVSAGVYLPEGVINADYGTEGVLQKWQIWNQEEFNEKHFVRYLTYFSLELHDLQPSGQLPASTYANDGSFQYICSQIPILINDTANYKVIENVAINLFNNKLNQDEYVFYKDLAEVINFTLQFEFYTNDDDITWSKYLFKNSPFIQQTQNKPNVVLDLSLSSFICYDKKYAIQSVYRIKLSEDISEYIEVGINTGNIPYIKVKWGSISSSITAFSISSEFDELSFITNCIDYIAFKRNGATEDVYYYLSFNDSKSSTAWKIYTSEDYAGLYKRVKCKKGIDREYEED